MGQVWSKADCDGTNEQGLQGGRGSCFAVTGQTPGSDGLWNGTGDVFAPLNDKMGELTIDLGSVTEDRVRGFNSLHPDGANFVRCDGSVAFTRENIDRLTYISLSTMNGGEVVSE